MNTATGILHKEHEVILRMLDVTDRIAQQLDRNETVTPETLHDVLEFFRVFADSCHHGKEEDLFFPLLEKKGMPREGGPIGVMLHEHDVGRSFVRQMVKAAEDFGQGEGSSGARWAEAARGYTTLLRQHIKKENEVLFVMAENMLSDSEQAWLIEEFEKAEEEKMGVGTHERLHALMDRLTTEILAA